MLKSNEQSYNAIEKLPEALAIQKKKLLIAIKEIDDGAAENISEEEEQLVKDVTETLGKLIRPLGTNPSQPWNDPKMSQFIKDLLERNALFELPKYLNCAKVVCAIFSTKNNSSQDIVRHSKEYVFTHARQFGDLTKTIFQIEATANQVTTSFSILVISSFIRHLSSQDIPRNSRIVKKVYQLIKELGEAYDEVKFQTLNAHITSFVLLISRREMKSYIILDSFITYRCLIIEAYLKCNDEKTKKNIRDTCGKDMEWYDMQLPCLFFKVIDLYGIGASEIWDLLSSVKSIKIAKSLFNLASEFNNKHQLSMADPSQSQRWFAYCRLLGKDYHRKLSNDANVAMCGILGNLIEMKNVNEKPDFNYNRSDRVKEIAARLIDKINK